MFSKFALIWEITLPYPELVLVEDVYGGRDRVVFIDRDYRAYDCWIAPDLVRSLSWNDFGDTPVIINDRGFAVQIMPDEDQETLRDLFSERLYLDQQA